VTLRGASETSPRPRTLAAGANARRTRERSPRARTLAAGANARRGRDPSLLAARARAANPGTSVDAFADARNRHRVP
jgi:hypothetical protein